MTRLLDRKLNVRKLNACAMMTGDLGNRGPGGVTCRPRRIVGFSDRGSCIDERPGYHDKTTTWLGRTLTFGRAVLVECSDRIAAVPREKRGEAGDVAAHPSAPHACETPRGGGGLRQVDRWRSQWL